MKIKTPKTPIDPKERMLTTTEAAERLRMKRDTLMKKCAAGLLPCSHPGKMYLIPQSVVDDLLAGERQFGKGKERESAPLNSLAQ